MFDITLTSSMQANLTSLQATSVLLGRTQERLATGLKVNSALDNPASFFAARAHNDRAGQLAARKEAISEAVQTLKQASNGVQGITKLIETLRGIVSQARSAEDAGNLATLADQYNAVLGQLDNVVTDSSYKGVNLLTAAASLKVNFNEDASTSLTLTGFDASAEGLGLGSGSGVPGPWQAPQLVGSPFGFPILSSVPVGVENIDTDINTWYYSGSFALSEEIFTSDFVNFYSQDGVPTANLYGSFWDINNTYVFTRDAGTALDAAGLDSAAELDALEQDLNDALDTLRTQSSQLAANLNILTTRQDFITAMTNTLVEGASKLTLADTNEEGANLLMLQTRQNLGTTALGLSAQSAQSVLRLF